MSRTTKIYNGAGERVEAYLTLDPVTLGGPSDVVGPIYLEPGSTFDFPYQPSTGCYVDLRGMDSANTYSFRINSAEYVSIVAEVQAAYLYGNVNSLYTAYFAGFGFGLVLLLAIISFKIVKLLRIS